MAYRPKRNTRNVIITPEEAEEILNKEHYERQRKLDQTYVDEYALDMELGDFRPETVITLGEVDSKRFVVNGQHTLHAIAKYGNPVEVLIQEYECDTIEDVQALYATFDHGHERSWKQLLDAVNLPEKLGLETHETECLNGAIPFLVGGFVPNPGARYNAGELLHSMRIRETNILAWKTEAQEYFKIIAGYDGILRRRLCLTSICAIALVTIRFCPELSHEFWEKLDVNEECDYRAAWRTYLEDKLYSHNNPQIRSRTAADAWNQWMRNREEEPDTARKVVIRPSRKTRTPLLLLGTPHDGKKILHYATLKGTPIHLPTVWEDEE